MAVVRALVMPRRLRLRRAAPVTPRDAQAGKNLPDSLMADSEGRADFAEGFPSAVKGDQLVIAGFVHAR